MKKNISLVIPGAKKEKVNTSKVITIQLKNAIDNLSLSNIMKGKAYKLACILIQKGIQDKQSLENYVPLPVKYLEKTFNKDYHKDFFNALKSNCIIECNEEYKQGSRAYPGTAKGYRINPDLLEGEFVSITYKEKYSERSKEEIRINRTYNFQERLEISESDMCMSSVSSSLPTTPISSSSLSTSTSLPTTSSSLYISSSSLLHINTRFFKKHLILDDLSSLRYDEDRLWKAIEDQVSNISTRF